MTYFSIHKLSMALQDASCQNVVDQTFENYNVNRRRAVLKNCNYNYAEVESNPH